MKLIENLSVVDLDDFLKKPKKWDIFISCVFSEERGTKGSNAFLDRNVEIETSIIFNYKEDIPENRKEKNIDLMKNNLGQICSFVYVFDTESISKPSEGIKKFLIYLRDKNISLVDKEIVLDITVFTIPYFFLLVKTLKERFNLSKFHVIYTEPEKYGGENSNSGIILTEGLDRIESIPGFFGSSVNSKDALIVLLGFEGNRSIEIFYDVSPELTYAINGFPSFRPGWHKVSLEANLRFLKESRAFEHLFFASAVDPFETREVLSQIDEELKRRTETSNTIIAPLGTKTQAFGALLYALQEKSVKVIYPFPSYYKPNYSQGYGHSWIFEVNLDTLDNSDWYEV